MGEGRTGKIWQFQVGIEPMTFTTLLSHALIIDLNELPVSWVANN